MMMFAVAATGSAASAQAFSEVLAELNNHKSISGSKNIKSYLVLFDAYKTMTEPPQPIGPSFNLATIHPKMSGWDEVSNWAEANGHMTEAIIKAGKKKILGLPYTVKNDQVPFDDAQLQAVIGEQDDFSHKSFPYLHAIQTMAAYATAETYRLMEAGKSDDALELSVGILHVLRQCGDRQFVAELEVGYALLTTMLANTRDIYYIYLDQISSEQFQKMAYTEIPGLLLDRRRLELPEGDHIVAKALINSVFDDRDQPDPEKFASMFGSIQAQEKPLTLFGAIRRWEQVAHVHASRQASLDRLKKIYDDWYRRWGWRQYEIMHAEATEFDLANPIRYAAVRYSLRDLELLFSMRNQLFAAINGTAMSAGLCGYYRYFTSAYPTDQEKIYNQFVRKTISDQDPYDRSYGRFLYSLTSKRTPIDTPSGRIWIEPDVGMLWARGEDHADSRGTPHSNDGAGGTDVLIWPPVKALLREKGMEP